MTIYPGGFGTPITDGTLLDKDDTVLGCQDGTDREFTVEALSTAIVPLGLYDAADELALPGVLLEAADATTNWTLALGSSGAVIAIDTTDKTQGAASVTGSLNMQTGVQSKLYYTFPTPAAIGTHTLIAFDVKYVLAGPTVLPVPELSCKVADDVALGGNVQTIPFPSIAQNIWKTVVLPVQGLGSIKSIGVHRTGSGVYPNTSNYRTTVKIDNVRWIDETQLDQALASASKAVAWIPPSYTPNASQYPLFLPAGKGLVDPALGVYSKANNVVQLHDYLAHVVGAENGLLDVGGDIARIINAAPAGSTIRATPGALYRFSTDIIITNRDVTIDFSGASCFLTYTTNTPFCTILGCRNVKIVGGAWFGYYPLTQNGSTMAAVAGSPTVASTTMLIDAQNEEAKIPAHTNWLVGSQFARHWPQQLGVTDDGLGPRAYCAFVLSDSAQVASDCQICVYDDTTGVLLNSRTLTLTATPTTYLLDYIGSNVRQRLRFTVKKLTATANTITVTSFTPYGENEYNGAYDIGSCFLIASSSGVTITEAWIEGFSGDAVQISDASVSDVTVRRNRSHACRRQGMSFNQGTDFVIEGNVLSAPGRSGIDFEPFADTWFTRRVRCFNNAFYDVVNYAYAMGNWARNFDYVIDGTDLYTARLGVIFGGFNGGKFRNSHIHEAYSASSYSFFGANMEIDNIWATGSVDCLTTTNTFDDGSGGGPVTFTPDGNVLRGVRTVGTGMAVKITLPTGYRLEGGTISPNTEAAFVATINQDAPIDTAGDFFGVHLGEYARQLPNTFKAPHAVSSIWMPGGFNLRGEPLANVRSISGGAVRRNNIGATDVPVTTGLTSLPIVFPTQNVGTLQNTMLGAGITFAGALLPSTTYYYRIAPRGRYSGPGVYLAQLAVTTGPSHTSISLQPRGLMDAASGILIEGLTVLRGTVNGGPYTTRFDVVPIRQIAAFPSSYFFMTDTGTSLGSGGIGYGSYTAQSGSWTGSVNESGWEPDASYRIHVETNWDSGHPWITGKAPGTFTINWDLGKPAPAGAKLSWSLIG